MWNESRSSSLAPERLTCKQNTSVLQRSLEDATHQIKVSNFSSCVWTFMWCHGDAWLRNCATSTERGTMGYPRLRPLGRPDYWLTCSPFSKVTCLVHWRSPPEPHERDIIMWRGVFIRYSLDWQWVQQLIIHQGGQKWGCRGFYFIPLSWWKTKQAGWEVKSADGKYRQSERGRKWLSGMMKFSS